MKVKQCFKCLEVKSLSDFYKHPAMSDGHVNKCKKCNRRDVRENRRLKVDYYRKYDRERGKLPGRYSGKKPRTSIQIKAHNSVARSIRSGDMTRPDRCERCASTDRIQAHHDDHSKPLDVMWLCPVCHANRHVELGKVKAMDD